ncbi:MAG: hypothetical protein OXI13_12355 [Gammaproteobacteria bacterium]|nr:hypothetical protein [Gammaproteobacteria bacterium]MDE0480402.1 hypothetical protein [Gammaproteobacteria bacterium]
MTAILKLLKLEDIAREALCWTLARLLGLPTPQAFLVQVDPSVVKGRFSGNFLHLAFGSEEIRRVFRDPGKSEMIALRNWRLAIDCAVFDTWIHCEDRYPNNLLIDVHDNFWLIDHEEALPNFANFDSESKSTLFQILKEGLSEFELRSMKRSAEIFATRCRNLDLVKLQELIFDKCVDESFRNPVAGHLEFLKNRCTVLPELIAKEFSFRQKPFVLDDDVREEMERYE